MSRARDRLPAVLVLVPSVVAVGVFVYGFIGWTAYVSLSGWTTFIPDLSFVGRRNYVELFQTFRFQADLRNTVVFTLTFLAACLVLGFLLAVLLDQRVRGEALFRNVFLFPMSISFIVTGVVWQWLLNPSTGINLLLEHVGLGVLRSPWYTEPRIAIFSVVLAATWQLSGFTMAMYLAGLRGIPEELLEAARVDGASEWALYRYVVVPLLAPITLSAVIVLGHISLKIFDLVFAMTGSGPAFSTDVPGVFMFETTFRGNRFAEGAAIAIVMLLLVAVLIVPYLWSTTRQEART
ncbi:MAG: sugar ABC transporter permease [Armatimonadota bacterium]|nr:sugar ABC transporter permease [Armatimonadota bacterium]MDR7449880.1 sugar ABC transporter permease [Armatimonadota bacterium]MDR7459210.1 sugar ABC transporter permease [Armatimonadota bacterium]MDR7479688.1 sugar ABC transporter permease [Armatimonadota bacterium]MDR7487825.1 sugar ABC transporter permease [Armatimonadota bacterium]